MDILRELKKKIADIDAQTLAMEGRSPTFTVSEIMDLIDSMESALPEISCSDFPNSSGDVPDINVGDIISRQAAIDSIKRSRFLVDAMEKVIKLPSAQPFHNTTMNEVLKYIDGMPEDVWQEFTACLECRGWELQRRTAKWCGGDFA